MKVSAIAIKPKSRGPMHLVDSVDVTQSMGIDGDSFTHKGARQITLLSAEQWQDACLILGTELPWTLRRANVLASGVSFSSDWLNKTFSVGDLILRVREETEPCAKMDQQFQGLRAALTPEWRGGICCEVIQGGSFRIGDPLVMQ